METTLKLLLIEDSDSDEKLLLRELKRGGFLALCHRVQTEAEMTASLATGGWDLIISDFRLPTFSGTEALSLLRKTEHDIPFILVSGTIGEQNAVDAMLAGATDYVMKDNLPRLIPAIHRALDEARVRAERRRAVSALYESEARFRNMADSAPVLLWMTDATGTLSYANRQWLDFTGRTLEEEVHTSRGARIHPDDLPVFESAIGAGASGKSVFQTEYRMRRRDGEWRWMLDTGSPRYGMDSVFEGFIGTCLDVTDRKKAEIEHNRILGENYRLMQEQERLAIAQKTMVRDIMYSVTDGKLKVCDREDELPAELPAGEGSIALTQTAGLAELRYRVEDMVSALGFDRGRQYDLITATSEASMNAVVHAGGGEARVLSDGRDCVQVWVVDQGRGIELESLPRATLEKGYTTAGSLGHGMKMMIGTVDRIWLLTHPTGTTVVLEQNRVAPDPVWLWASRGGELDESNPTI